jgi:hypothetical protein
VFLTGIIMVFLGVAMIAGAVAAPAAVRPGLIGGAVGLLGAGLVLTFLDWPSRSRPPRDGMVRADAYLLDARLTGGEATGFRMVEMTLEVRPRDGVPFQVTRKFVADMARLETGQRVRVYFDPADPERLELA